MTASQFTRAARIASIEVSEIVVMSEAARARRAAGHDIISLGIGEPDFETPEHVSAAAIAALASIAVIFAAIVFDLYAMFC